MHYVLCETSMCCVWDLIYVLCVRHLCFLFETSIYFVSDHFFVCLQSFFPYDDQMLPNGTKMLPKCYQNAAQIFKFSHYSVKFLNRKKVPRKFWNFYTTTLIWCLDTWEIFNFNGFIDWENHPFFRFTRGMLTGLPSQLWPGQNHLTSLKPSQGG